MVAERHTLSSQERVRFSLLLPGSLSRSFSISGRDSHPDSCCARVAGMETRPTKLLLCHLIEKSLSLALIARYPSHLHLFHTLWSPHYLSGPSWNRRRPKHTWLKVFCRFCRSSWKYGFQREPITPLFVPYPGIYCDSSLQILCSPDFFAKKNR